MKTNSKTIFGSLPEWKAKLLKGGVLRNQTKEKPSLRAELFSADQHRVMLPLHKYTT
jgi:hypothetical protein